MTFMAAQRKKELAALTPEQKAIERIKDLHLIGMGAKKEDLVSAWDEEQVSISLPALQMRKTWLTWPQPESSNALSYSSIL